MKVGDFMYDNSHSPFVAVIDNVGFIYQYNQGRRGQAVGIDNQKAQELESEFTTQSADMQEVIDKLYQELVDAGLRTVPKSPEEIAREAAEAQLEFARQQAAQQAEINANLLSAMKSMQEELQGLKMAQNSKDCTPSTVYPINKNKKPPVKDGVGND